MDFIISKNNWDKIIVMLKRKMEKKRMEWGKNMEWKEICVCVDEKQLD